MGTMRVLRQLDLGTCALLRMKSFCSRASQIAAKSSGELMIFCQRKPSALNMTLRTLHGEAKLDAIARRKQALAHIYLNFLCCKHDKFRAKYPNDVEHGVKHPPPCHKHPIPVGPEVRAPIPVAAMWLGQARCFFTWALVST